MLHLFLDKCLNFEMITNIILSLNFRMLQNVAELSQNIHGVFFMYHFSPIFSHSFVGTAGKSRSFQEVSEFSKNSYERAKKMLHNLILKDRYREPRFGIVSFPARSVSQSASRSITIHSRKEKKSRPVGRKSL